MAETVAIADPMPEGILFYIAQVHEAPIKEVIQVEDAKIRREDGFYDIEIHVPPYAPVAFNRDMRKGFESAYNLEWAEEQKRLLAERGEAQLASEFSPLRWSAGGMLLIVDGHIVMIRRDEGARPYPLTFTLSSGLSHNKEEVYDPSKVMWREGIEEVVFYNNKGELLLPESEDAPSGMSLEECVLNAVGKIGLSSRVGGRFKVRYNDDFANAEVSTYNNGTLMSRVKGIYNLDPAIGGLDVLGVLEIEGDIEEFNPCFTEFFTKDGQIVKLPNDITYLPIGQLPELKEGQEFDFLYVNHHKGERGTKTYTFELTPVLREVIGKIR